MLRGGNQDVNSPHPTERRLAKQFEIGRSCHIAGNDDDAGGRERGQFVEPASISRKDDELRAFADELLDDRAAQPAAGSCHHRDFVQ